MSDQPLAKFKSRISGKNADVVVWPDRVEWSLGRSKVGRAAAATATMGVSLAVSRGSTRSTEMIPVGAITSVSSERDGMRHTVVRVHTAAGVVEFRCPHDDAAAMQRLIMELVTAG